VAGTSKSASKKKGKEKDKGAQEGGASAGAKEGGTEAGAPPASGAASGAAGKGGGSAAIDSAVVSRLRDMTGAPPKRCEDALRLHNGNADSAALWLLLEASNGAYAEPEPEDGPAGAGVPSPAPAPAASGKGGKDSEKHGAHPALPLVSEQCAGGHLYMVARRGGHRHSARFADDGGPLSR
jgi:hypothetical protein